MLTIDRLSVTASLDEPTGALERASAEARAGDRSWQQWVAEYRRGEATIVRLDVVLQAHDEEPRTIEVTNYGVFIEVHPHAPKIERQISDIVSKDFAPLADELCKVGHDFDRDELYSMYVHVELGDDLRELLSAADERAAAASARTPHVDARVAERSGP